jgi:cell wall-associated protease
MTFTKRTSLLALFCVSLALSASGQLFQKQKPPKDWFLLDPQADQFQGLSVSKAYEALNGQPSKPVIVAVIDTGVDTDHEDLRNVIWVNEDEIPNNGLDDDKNGYVDDVNGWNFIGGKGGSVNDDTYEVTREYARLNKKFASADVKKLSKKDKVEYGRYVQMKERWEEKRAEDEQQYTMVRGLYSNFQFSMDTLKKFLKKEVTADALAEVHSNDPNIIFAKSFLNAFFSNANGATPQEQLDELKEAYDAYKSAYEISSNPDFDPRSIVGDNYQNPFERNYGNNNVKPLPGPAGDHGTHVAGIIAADRNNDVGIQGIADHVKIMVLRAVPNGDERDKDIANSIYYAVDNGARVINMSCGKTVSPQKEAVDKAVQYAEAKGVLIIHAAGNESADNDKVTHYPSAIYNNGKEAKNWLNVGASSWGEGEDFIGSFTNYGKKTVDVFSPGVAIYSTVPHNGYKNHDGTSMAAPAVAGVAALLMTYFPEFSAVEIKNILTESSRKFDGMIVEQPGSKNPIPFGQLSKTGGIVNAYDAVQLAMKKRAEKKTGSR